jgi:hypothetical protein
MQCSCAIFSSVACPVLQYFSTLSHKWRHLRGWLFNTKCVFWFSLQIFSGIFLLLTRSERGIVIPVYWYSLFMSSTRYSCQIFRKHEFLDRFSKNTQISNFTKIRPGGEAELFHTDGRTDRTDAANGHFSQFCESAPKQKSQTLVSEIIIWTVVCLSVDWTVQELFHSMEGI